MTRLEVMPGRSSGPPSSSAMRRFEVAVPGRTGGAAEGLDFAGELLAGEGHDLERDLLAGAEVAAVELADVGADLPDLQIGNLRDGHAGRAPNRRPGRAAAACPSTSCSCWCSAGR